MESEYCALNDGAHEVVWLHRLLLEFQVTTSHPSLLKEPHIFRPQKFNIKLFCDNNGAIKLSQNPIFHARSKYIKIHYHFIERRS
jgi:hypothetical protein